MIDLIIVPCCESHAIAVNQTVHQSVPDYDDDDDGCTYEFLMLR